MSIEDTSPTSHLYIYVYVLKQEAQRGPSEALNTARFPQYSPRSVASRAVLRDLGRIEGRGRPLKCFLVLLPFLLQTSIHK